MALETAIIRPHFMPFKPAIFRNPITYASLQKKGLSLDKPSDTMKYLYLLACLWPTIVNSQALAFDPNPTPATSKTNTRDFDLSKPNGVAEAFLYTAQNSDYHYLRALCNPFVEDYGDIAEGKLNEICYWLPRFGDQEGSLKELKAEFAGMGNYKLSEKAPEILEDGRVKYARVTLVGKGSNPSETVVVLKNVGQWWFLHRWED